MNKMEYMVACVTISLTFGLFLMQYTHGQTVDNQTTVDTIEFSISVPDNWAYHRGLFSQVILTPSEFSEILADESQGLDERLKEKGAHADFAHAWYYPIENAPFDTFVKYQMSHNFNFFKLTSAQKVTIDNEPAIKIYADGIKGNYADFSGTKSVLYWVWHDEKPYTLEYTANVKDFEKYLPQFEQIVKTFKFT